MSDPAAKRKCPFCARSWVGLAPDGEPFIEKHLRECFERTPPDARSSPVAMNLVKCACGSEEFTLRVHHDRFHGIPSLDEYGCRKCGRIQTVQLGERRKPAC